jgi:hypothetical protein
MSWLGAAAALMGIALVFIDAFQVMILPRRVSYTYRLARIYYRWSWVVWRAAAHWFPAGRRRQTFLSIFGPLSLFGLLAIWATGLIAGFALLHWSAGTAIAVPAASESSFSTYLYFSGTTFFTLGYGDVVPTGMWGRVASVAEAGIGFGFLAVVISYLPVLYQAFSQREITISLLDARAGSPPSAGELLRRFAQGRGMANIGPLLAEWERWAAQLLESHLSFPVLSYYRSQHDNQSWLAALTAILDTSALFIAAIDRPERHQARLTFAMARHTAVDLSLVFHATPRAADQDRLPDSELVRVQDSLASAGLEIRDRAAAAAALKELRGLYEPFVTALAGYFQFALPGFLPQRPPVDNWQTSAWMRRSPDLSRLPAAGIDDEHFD